MVKESSRCAAPPHGSADQAQRARQRPGTGPEFAQQKDNQGPTSRFFGAAGQARDVYGPPSLWRSHAWWTSRAGSSNTIGEDPKTVSITESSKSTFRRCFRKPRKTALATQRTSSANLSASCHAESWRQDSPGFSAPSPGAPPSDWWLTPAKGAASAPVAFPGAWLTAPRTWSKTSIHTTGVGTASRLHSVTVTLEIHPLYGQELEVVRSYGADGVWVELSSGERRLLPVRWTSLRPRRDPLQVQGQLVRLDPDAARQLSCWVADRRNGLGVSGQEFAVAALQSDNEEDGQKPKGAKRRQGAGSERVVGQAGASGVDRAKQRRRRGGHR